MELNREQIIKALELHSQKAKPCLDECSYAHRHYCGSEMAKDALSLINELTEENERLKSVEFTCGFVKPHKVLECPIFDEIEKAKADTVREFAERLTTCFCPDADYSGYDIKRVIEQIVNDMGK